MPLQNIYKPGIPLSNIVLKLLIVNKNIENIRIVHQHP